MPRRHEGMIVDREQGAQGRKKRCSLAIPLAHGSRRLCSFHPMFPNVISLLGGKLIEVLKAVVPPVAVIYLLQVTLFMRRQKRSSNVLPAQHRYPGHAAAAISRR